MKKVNKVGYFVMAIAALVALGTSFVALVCSYFDSAIALGIVTVALVIIIPVCVVIIAIITIINFATDFNVIFKDLTVTSNAIFK